MVMVLVYLTKMLFKGIGKVAYYTGYAAYKGVCGLFSLASEVVDRVDANYERLDKKLLKLAHFDTNENKDKKGDDKTLESKVDQYDTKVVTTNEDMIKFTNQGYDCQSLGENRWLMKKRVS